MVQLVPLIIEELASYEVPSGICEEVTGRFALIFVLKVMDPPLAFSCKIVLCPRTDCDVFFLIRWEDKDQ
jgi:hypothetical protein